MWSTLNGQDNQEHIEFRISPVMMESKEGMPTKQRTTRNSKIKTERREHCQLQKFNICTTGLTEDVINIAGEKTKTQKSKEETQK